MSSNSTSMIKSALSNLSPSKILPKMFNTSAAWLGGSDNSSPIDVHVKLDVYGPHIDPTTERLFYFIAACLGLLVLLFFVVIFRWKCEREDYCAREKTIEENVY